MKTSLSIGLMLFFVLSTSFVEAVVMDVPTEPQTFSYFPGAGAVLDSDPAVAQPIGIGNVADGGDNLSLNVSLPQFTGPVDVYFGISAASLSPDIYLLHPDMTLQPLSAGLVPWIAGTSGPIQQSLFGDIPEIALPDGDYLFAVMVTPAQPALRASAAEVLIKAMQSWDGSGVRNASAPSNRYYIWVATERKCPSVFGRVVTGASVALHLDGKDATSGSSFKTDQNTNITVYKNNKIFGQSSGNHFTQVLDATMGCSYNYAGTVGVTIRGVVCEDPALLIPAVGLNYQESYSSTTSTLVCEIPIPVDPFSGVYESFVGFYVNTTASVTDTGYWPVGMSLAPKTWTLTGFPIR